MKEDKNKMDILIGKIYANPKTTPIPKSPVLQTEVMLALMKETGNRTLEAFVIYALRMPIPVTIFGLKGLYKIFGTKMSHDNNYLKWFCKNEALWAESFEELKKLTK